ncbi:MAG: hypothetical protein KC457_06385 [Myxococcales bacterium]|nr:hypothetical protein [Myxococcales bacterium]
MSTDAKVVRRLLLSTVLAMAACDRSGEAKSEAAPAQPAAEAQPAVQPSPVPGETASADAPAETPKPAPAPAEAKPVVRSFEEEVAALTAGAVPSAADEKTAWTHYKAKQFPDAQRHFALASLQDREQWKHPFNLACASAKAKDEAMVQVALREAVRRDAAAVGVKARKDADLEGFRDAAWFEAVLRGEPQEQTSGEGTSPSAPSQPVSTGGGLPLGVAKPVAAAELAKLRAKLEGLHGLKPIIRGSLASVGPKGEAVAYLVYEYGLFEACLLEGTKRSCREKLGGEDQEDDDEINRLQCTKQWFARATMVAGDWAVDHDELKVSCSINEVRLDALDLDGDGKQEVVIDVRGRAELVGFRESDVLEVGRFVEVLRLDGSSQFVFRLDWQASDMAPGEATTKRLLARDENGDGRIDLIVESADFIATSNGTFDRDFWPNDDEETDRGPSSFEVWNYDVAADEWQ